MVHPQAIVMAAGLGTRMSPVTLETPKPLVTVQGTSMIETVIGALLNAGVTRVHIVVGYLKEQFQFLTEKYPSVTLINNEEYLEKNNISSIYAAAHVLDEGPTFICEGDLVISDPQILCQPLESSCYFGRMVQGHTDDWVFDCDSSGRITRVGKKGNDTYAMVGLSFFNAQDARHLAEYIRRAYQQDGHEQLFWDDIVNKHIQELDLRICPVQANQISEIDTVEELVAHDPSYAHVLKETNHAG
ncbi:MULTISPECIES: NTP transferase domain-containing protein [unclassified Schaalia]|uniref:NTP transferase domain-containing protein n=1 Tax=unclassified Schaalia TaxID=2691889 RepID=UPI001E386A66|nr:MULTISPECIES: NTP transferase domain-containing protein [unclassified Schaalia]MCD4550328.1 NTP transferase domain-containing protein [Schaalia sp. lx-260]MCD4557766.1 NTP transferase domain-containing protein [Schaalia sp. lx-100]